MSLGDASDLLMSVTSALTCCLEITSLELSDICCTSSQIVCSGEDTSLESWLFMLGEDDIARLSRMGWHVAGVHIYTCRS